MELKGQWAPAVQMDAERRQGGHRRRPRLVPVPDRRRRRGRCHGRVRRRQRLRRRQGCPARGGRLPQVLHQRSTNAPSIGGAQRRHSPPTVGTEASITDPALRTVLESGTRRRSSSCTSTRPRPRRWAPRSTRLSRPYRGHRHAGAGQPGDHRRGRGGRLADAYRRPSASGPAHAGPLDFASVE